jgi:hypothetical protein
LFFVFFFFFYVFFLFFSTRGFSPMWISDYSTLVLRFVLQNILDSQHKIRRSARIRLISKVEG